MNKTDDISTKIIDLRNKGFTQNEIAQELNINRSKVNQVLTDKYGAHHVERKGRYHYTSNLNITRRISDGK